MQRFFETLLFPIEESSSISPPILQSIQPFHATGRQLYQFLSIYGDHFTDDEIDEELDKELESPFYEQHIRRNISPIPFLDPSSFLQTHSHTPSQIHEWQLDQNQDMYIKPPSTPIVLLEHYYSSPSTTISSNTMLIEDEPDWEVLQGEL